MEFQVKQLNKLKIQYNVPVICAGDIFDKWNPSPELINWAIDWLPEMYAIPGQHDLPLHNYDDITKSGYWTLVLAGVIQDLATKYNPKIICGAARLALWGFPWGHDITPCPTSEFDVNIAIVHKYIWSGRASAYQSVDPKDNILQARPSFEGYSIVVIGDNHKSWSTKLGGQHIWNCGGFMRRKSDEINYKPRLGLLMSNGTIQPHYLDISLETIEAVQEHEEQTEEWFLGIKEFVESLKTTGPDSLDYRALVQRVAAAHGATTAALALLLEALDSGD